MIIAGLRLWFRSILFIDNGEFSQANRNFQRNQEYSSIDLVYQVDKTISFIINKLDILQAPEGEGSRIYTFAVEDGDVDYVNQIPNPVYVNQMITEIICLVDLSDCRVV